MNIVLVTNRRLAIVQGTVECFVTLYELGNASEFGVAHLNWSLIKVEFLQWFDEKASGESVCLDSIEKVWAFDQTRSTTHVRWSSSWGPPSQHMGTTRT
jgi:hypothetical protein